MRPDLVLWPDNTLWPRDHARRQRLSERIRCVGALLIRICVYIHIYHFIRTDGIDVPAIVALHIGLLRYRHRWLLIWRRAQLATDGGAAGSIEKLLNNLRDGGRDAEQ